MNGQNTSKTAAVLKKYALDYIPEAHCYLRYQNHIIDCTSSQAFNFEKDLLQETAIEAKQAGSYKTALHKKFLQNWLYENPQIKYSLLELWQIREACIAALSA